MDIKVNIKCKGISSTMEWVFCNPWDFYTQANPLINTYQRSMVSRKSTCDLTVNNTLLVLGNIMDPRGPGPNAQNLQTYHLPAKGSLQL